MTANTPSVPVAHGRKAQKMEAEVVIHCPPDEVYAFWRDFRNLSRFMDSVESVEWTQDQRVSRWHVRGPLGIDMKWDAVIINDHPGSLIAWETLHNSDMPSAGSVRFDPMDEPGWTRVRLTVDYYPPGGALAVALAALLYADPERVVEQDLKRLKVVLEG